MPYYFLLTGRLGGETRELLFGDYELETVEDEKQDYQDHGEYCSLQVKRLIDDKQATIDAHINTLRKKEI